MNWLKKIRIFWSGSHRSNKCRKFKWKIKGNRRTEGNSQAEEYKWEKDISAEGKNKKTTSDRQTEGRNEGNRK